MQLHAVNWLEKKIQLSRYISIAVLCSFNISCASLHTFQTNSQTQLQLGLAYFQLQQYTLAEKCLLKAALSKKNRLSAQKVLAYLYQLTGDLKAAENIYEQMVKTYPTSSQVHNNYAIFLCQQNQYQKAKFEFKLALKYNPSKIIIHKNLSLCRKKLALTFPKPLMYYT